MRLRRDNRGSSIVTVLVVVTFMTILVTTLIYITGMNFKSKQADYQNTQSFYVNEITADEIKARFVLETSEAFEKAYKKTMIQYANMDAVARDILYEETFVDAIRDQWDAKKVSPSDTNLDVLQNTFGLTAPGEIISVGAWNFDQDNGFAQLQDIVISYTDARGNTNMISTDIYMAAPEFDWSIDTAGAWLSGVDDSREVFQMEDVVIFKNWHKY